MSTAMLSILKTIFIASEYEKLRYRCAITLYALILLLGSIPGARANADQIASGFILHSASYSVLTFLLFSGSPGTPFQRAIKSLATIMLMGALDEIVQTFFQYRHGSALDWLVDCNAAIITSLLLWTFWPKAGRAPQS